MPVLAADAEKLLDLDLAGFVPASEGSSGIVNAGTSKTAEINIYSTANVKLGKQSLTNAYRQNVSYISKTNAKPDWLKVGHATKISDIAWEGEGSTFSFWADLSSTTVQRGDMIAEYRAVYNTGSSEETSVFELFEVNIEEHTNYSWNIGYDGDNDPISMAASRGWTHVMITNPKLDENGSKTMDLYINGVYKKSKTINITSGSEPVSATLSLGGSAVSTASLYYVPAYSRYGNIVVYKGALTDTEIAGIYESEKDIFTPLTSDIRFSVLNSDGEEQQTHIGYTDLLGGITAGLVIDNPNTDEAVEATLFAAVYDDDGMKEAKASETITVPGGNIGYEVSYPLGSLLPDVALGDRVAFYLWTDELTPLMGAKSLYVKDMLLSDSEGCRLVIAMDAVPSAASLKPSAFTVTANGESYTVDRCVYYPLTKELHLIINNASGISAPCRVMARLTEFGGASLNFDAAAAVASYEDNPMYGDSIKYVAMYRDGTPVCSAYEDGTYTIEVCAVLQGESRFEPVDIVVYRKSGGTETEIGRRTASFTEEDYTFTLSCELECGDTVYAKLN